MKNILITGANGYVGRNLALHFAVLGHKVTLLLRHIDGAVPHHENIRVHVAPDYNRAEWQAGETFQGINVVVHAAARAHRARENRSAFFEQLYREDNMNFPRRMAEKAAANGVKRFIFISSIGAEVLENKFHEGCMTWAQAWRQNPYKASKLKAERLLRTLGEDTGLEIVCVRLPMVYGPDAPGNFAKFTRWLQRGIPLPIKGIHNPRAFVSIETVRDFLALCLDHPKAAARVWSIRDEGEVSSPEFATLISKAAQTKAPRFFHFPVSVLKYAANFFGFGEQIRSLFEPLHIDISQPLKKLGWRPQLTVVEGIAKAFESR